MRAVHGQVDGALCERPSSVRFAAPERAVAESLHLARELDRGRLAIERPGEDADATGVGAVKSRQAHDPLNTTSFAGAGGLVPAPSTTPHDRVIVSAQIGLTGYGSQATVGV